MATGDETITVNRDTRGAVRLQKNDEVWEIKLTAAHDADDTGDVTQAILDMNVILQKIVFTVPNYTNAITGQLVIKDNDDATIFDSGEKAKNATYAYNLSEPLSGTVDVVMGVSGAAGGSGGSMTAVLRGI